MQSNLLICLPHQLQFQYLQYILCFSFVFLSSSLALGILGFAQDHWNSFILSRLTCFGFDTFHVIGLYGLNLDLGARSLQANWKSTLISQLYQLGKVVINYQFDYYCT